MALLKLEVSIKCIVVRGPDMFDQSGNVLSPALPYLVLFRSPHDYQKYLIKWVNCRNYVLYYLDIFQKRK